MRAFMVLLVAWPVLAIATPKQPVLDAEAKSHIPEGGLWFAGQASLENTSGPFVVYHVTRDGVTEAYRNETDAITAFGWSDAHTLVTVIASGDRALVQTFHDGAFARVFKVAADDWGLGQGQVLTGSPALAITRDGEIWLSQCVTAATPCKRAALRVDQVPYTAATHLPATVAADRVSHVPGAVVAGHAKPPAGVTVKLAAQRLGDAMVSGVSCHTATGDATWPTVDDAPTAIRPSRISWISTKPALYAVEGTAPGARTPTTLVFRACDPEPLADYLDLGDGLWAELAVVDDGAHGRWLVSSGTSPVAYLSGSPTGFVMAPR